MEAGFQSKTNGRGIPHKLKGDFLILLYNLHTVYCPKHKYAS